MTNVSDVQAAAAEFIADVEQLTADTNSADAVITGPAFGAASIVDVGPRSLKTLARVLSEIENSRGWLMRGIWSGVTTYAALDVVGYAGRVWVSMADANLNHAPVVGSAYWMVLYDGLDGVVPSRAEISSLTISASTFMVAGFYEMGDGGAGATYSSIGATTDGPMPVYDAVGTLFNLVLVDPLRPGWFGADGRYETVSVPLGAPVIAIYKQLNMYYTTLAEAQDVYPWVTSLDQYLGYVGLQSMFYAAFGPLGSEYGNDHFSKSKIKKCFIPAGFYYLGDASLLIRNVHGGSIEGGGRNITYIQGTGQILFLDGFWYSQLRGITFFNDNAASTAYELVRLDRTVGIYAYDGHGVQGNTFADLLFQAGGGTRYCLSMGRAGAGDAQGSENLFLNTHYSGAEDACVYISGGNAIANQFIGGDMQAYKKHGFDLEGGAAALIRGFSFEVVYHSDQFTNNGYDIFAGAFAVNSPLHIEGCRTEGVRFFYGVGSNFANIYACASQTSLPFWPTASVVAVGTVCRAVGPGRNMVFQCTVGGTTGGSEPTWTEDGTPVTDNTATWVERPFYFVNSPQGYIDTVTCNSYTFGYMVSKLLGPGLAVKIQADYQMRPMDRKIMIYSASGNIAIKMPQELSFAQGAFQEAEFTFTRVGGDANAVTLSILGGYGVEFWTGGTYTFDSSLAKPQTVTFIGVAQSFGGNYIWSLKSKQDAY